MAEWYKSERFVFNYNAHRKVPSSVEHAVYVFWSLSKSRAVYVGKTDRSLRQRLRQHRDITDNATLRSWIDYDTEDLQVCYMTLHAIQEPEKPDKKTKRLVGMLEKQLIRELQPIANKIKYNN